MDNAQDARSITEVTDPFAELREQVSSEALGQGSLDSVALGFAPQAAPLSDEEYLEQSG